MGLGGFGLEIFRVGLGEGIFGGSGSTRLLQDPASGDPWKAIDASPIGNWMDAEAVLELEAMKEAAATVLYLLAWVVASGFERSPPHLLVPPKSPTSKTSA